MKLIKDSVGRSITENGIINVTKYILWANAKGGSIVYYRSGRREYAGAPRLAVGYVAVRKP